MAAVAPATAAKTVEAVVAAGRSVTDATGQLRMPGQTAQVDVADLKRLRSLGFLAPKGEEVLGARTGPHVTASAGPRVTLA